MNGNAAIDLTPDAQEAAALALPIPEQAKSIAIRDDDSLRRGNEILLTIKDLRKKIADTFGPICSAAFAAHKAAVKAQKDAEAPLVEAEGIIKPAIARYMAEAERKRREEEARLAEIARKQAEEAALAAAIEAEEAGAPPEEVQAIVEAPVFIPQPLAPPAPKLEGISIRKVVKFEVTDLLALVKAIAAGQVPVEAVEPASTVIGAQARSLRGSLRWPGVRVWEEDSVAAGRR
jgi:hypothetical protein